MRNRIYIFNGYGYHSFEQIIKEGLFFRFPDVSSSTLDSFPIGKYKRLTSQNVCGLKFRQKMKWYILAFGAQSIRDGKFWNPGRNLIWVCEEKGTSFHVLKSDIFLFFFFQMYFLFFFVGYVQETMYITSERVAVKIRSIDIINLFANSFMYFCLSLPSCTHQNYPDSAPCELGCTANKGTII